MSPGPKAMPQPEARFGCACSIDFKTNITVADDILPKWRKTSREAISADGCKSQRVLDRIEHRAAARMHRPEIDLRHFRTGQNRIHLGGAAPCESCRHHPR